MLVAQGFLFKFLLFNALPHNPEGSGEQLHGHYGPLVNGIMPLFRQHFSEKQTTVAWHSHGVLLYLGCGPLFFPFLRYSGI